ncbi:MAG: 1-acyl-sn-glycerol-3-phosphate acyltransferase [Hydromonas sp.]|nr:1-acyl-sn-glycerol-3-phosphate acyltransferase [Hydromonas sp.]
MWSKISFAILKLFGWKTTFEPFPEPRGIIVVYPHTSNWDFPLGLLWKSVNKVKPRWVAKESLFKPPVFGWLMRKLGGIGIKREGNLDVAQSLKKAMLAENECWLVIAIEGTRSYKPYIHLGYYYIAKAADVPIGLAQFDYKTKTVRVGEYRRVKDTPEEELEQLKIDFAHHNAYAPKNVSALAIKQKRKDNA